MRRELPLLSDIHIARCYSPSGFSVSSVQLHGAYGGVVYLRLTDPAGNVHTEIVVAKTKVSPIKRLSIPRLELCGAQLLTKLLCHGKRILNIPVTSVFAWTDSTIVLTWLTGNPRRFKTYVGNRISFIIDQLPPPPPPPRLLEACRWHTESCRLCLEGTFPFTTQRPRPLVEWPPVASTRHFSLACTTKFSI